MRYTERQLNLEILLQYCRLNATDVVIFNFVTNNLDVSVIFFEITLTLLVTVKNYSVAWFIKLDANNCIDFYIPKEHFLTLRLHLTPIEDGSGKIHYVPNNFYQSLLKAARDIKLLKTPTKSQIISSINKANHVNSKISKNDDLPFFKAWVHNKTRRVTQKNLDKIERAFGYEIRCKCEQSNISARWTATPNFINTNLLV